MDFIHILWSFCIASFELCVDRALKLVVALAPIYITPAILLSYYFYPQSRDSMFYPNSVSTYKTLHGDNGLEKHNPHCHCLDNSNLIWLISIWKFRNSNSVFRKMWSTAIRRQLRNKSITKTVSDTERIKNTPVHVCAKTAFGTSHSTESRIIRSLYNFLSSNHYFT
jgi:hypothetical protein